MIRLCSFFYVIFSHKCTSDFYSMNHFRLAFSGHSHYFVAHVWYFGPILYLHFSPPKYELCFPGNLLHPFENFSKSEDVITWNFCKFAGTSDTLPAFLVQVDGAVLVKVDW